MQIVIPAYKPDERLISLVKELHEKTDYGIIVVNDGSGEEFDRIFAMLPEYVTLLVHEVNKGKGRAMKTSFEYLLANFPNDAGAVIADADGQHLVKDIINVAEHLEQTPDRLIIGSRRFTGNVPFRSRFGNSVTRGVFAIASGVKVYDTQSGLRGIPAKYMDEYIALKGERYEYEMNMLLKSAELGITIEETVIETVYIDENESSHFSPFKDSLKIYAVIFKFIFSSMFCSILDYGIFVFLSLITMQMDNENMQNLICTANARIASSLVNFFINQKTVFKGSKKSGLPIFKYYLTVAVVYGVNFGLLTLMTNVFGWSKYIAQIIGMIVTYPLSYYAQRVFVFKTRSKKTEA